MKQVYLNNKVVFEGTDEEVEKYCEKNEWDYIQDPGYAKFERMCGIY